jgi:hypothetical protein
MRGHLAFFANTETRDFALQDERLSLSHPWITNTLSHPFENSIRVDIPPFFKTFSVPFV